MPRLVLILCTIGLLSTLGGCALASTYQLASIAATGLSYVLTGNLRVTNANTDLFTAVNPDRCAIDLIRPRTRRKLLRSHRH